MNRGFGWDIGGAHLKGARCETGGGGALAWRLEPFALWRDPERLPRRLAALAADLGADSASRHAITMTAELSDIFPDRAAGVRAVLRAARAALGGRVLVLDVDGALIEMGEADREPDRVAAANWMASATLAAGLIDTGLLIDTGSTTTDIVPLAAGRPAPSARHDTGRRACGELVYTGALRTPPAALADRVPLGDGWCRTAPEYFTQMADAYVLLGRIGAAEYTAETPDGRGRSPDECATRLARLIAAAPADLNPEALPRIATYLEGRQIALIAGAIAEVAGRMRTALPASSQAPRCALVAGAGAWLAAAAARQVGFEVATLAGTARLDAPASPSWDVAAPAVALAVRLAAARA